MTATTLALIGGGLLIGGGVAAYAFSKRIALEGQQRLTFMATLAAWVILFGILPFFAFAIGVGQVRAAAAPNAFASGVINAIPFTMLASPVIGFIHGLKLVRGHKQQQA